MASHDGSFRIKAVTWGRLLECVETKYSLLEAAQDTVQKFGVIHYLLERVNF